MSESMRNHILRPAFAAWIGALAVSLLVLGSPAVAAASQAAPEQPTRLLHETSPTAARLIASGIVPPTPYSEGAPIRLAVRLGIGFQVGPVYGQSYCSQPGYCYPTPQVRETVVPRRVKRPAKVTKITPARRKRVAKPVTPKRQLVRSVANPGRGVGSLPAARPVSVGGGPVGDSTGGSRATPQFRESRGGGPVSVGDTSGGGRVTPTFRTAPGGSVSLPAGPRGRRR